MSEMKKLIESVDDLQGGDYEDPSPKKRASPSGWTLINETRTASGMVYTYQLGRGMASGTIIFDEDEIDFIANARRFVIKPDEHQVDFWT